MNAKKFKMFHYFAYAYLLALIIAGPILITSDIATVASFYIPTSLVMIVILIIYYSLKKKVKAETDE